MFKIERMLKKIMRSRFVQRLNNRYGKRQKNENASITPWMRDLSTPLAISKLKKIGIEIDSVIDIGASDGRWTAELLPLYPKAKVLLIEANPYHKASLNKFVANNKNTQYYLGAAGNKKDTVCFDAKDPFGGLAFNSEVFGDEIIKVPSNTVDNLVAEYNLPGKHLLKLDTHGFEVPIFEGAKESLKNTNLLIVETYGFRANENALKFYEICSYMENLGFSVVDFSEPLWRDKDGIFWQFDLFFIPSSHPNLKYLGYK